MRTLILSCNTGAGHNSCAKAIQEVYQSCGETCDVIDALLFISKRASKFISNWHTRIYRYAPKLFKAGYADVEQHESIFREGTTVYKYLTSGVDRMREYLESGSYVIGEIINADYKITARVRVGNAEFVLGEHPKAPSPFVTWQRNCKNDGDGPPNFFWGHYGADRAAMIEDFCERTGSEYQEQKERRVQREQSRTALKKERGEER